MRPGLQSSTADRIELLPRELSDELASVSITTLQDSSPVLPLVRTRLPPPRQCGGRRPQDPQTLGWMLAPELAVTLCCAGAGPHPRPVGSAVAGWSPG